jgi:rubrerythrin
MMNSAEATPVAPITDHRTEGGTRARLETLVRSGQPSAERSAAWDWRDDLSHLDAEKRASWRRVLSAVASTELLEERLMRRLSSRAKRDPSGAAYVREYLEAHAADERRHHQLLSRYVRNTFGGETQTRGGFQNLSVAFSRKPLYGYALLHAYEKFSILLYEQLRLEAQKDGAQNLLTILSTLSHDEQRHVAGLELLIADERARRGGLSASEQLAVRGVLRVMLADVDLRPWALHNREVRENFKNLGFDPDELTREAKATGAATLALLGKPVSPENP